ncbi:hypothetical protein D9757_003398 [Collybiopsis confluens]|uniref:DUF6699 domain-containing protein n=1 Tax=Collybiopsis confluens TaxID=2823264 RepID=A0A8H5HU58_9AGAR|nr:hypothetical protein D9757_003398 [Collybiopsis confluens]
MPSNALGWEGMRIRTKVREALKNPRTSDEGKDVSTRIMKDFERLRVDEAAETRQKEISRIVRNDLPNLGTAHEATEKALEAPRRVLEYLQLRRKEYKELLSSRYSEFMHEANPKSGFSSSSSTMSAILHPHSYSDNPLIIEPPVIPPSTSTSSRSPSPRARSRASPRPHTHHSPSLSPSPVLPSEDFSAQPVFGMSSGSRSRTATPEIFIPPLSDFQNTGPTVTDPVPVQVHTAPAPVPWSHTHLSYPQFNYYPPQPYTFTNVYTPYIATAPEIWPPPLLSAPYHTPQFPPPSAGYGYPTPFNVSTVHNTPFLVPPTPMAMGGPPTPWMPTTPWIAGSPAVRINPRLGPGALRWDLLHDPDQARYVNDWGALKAPKFSDEGLTMAQPESEFPVKVTKIQITSSEHSVLNYWMPIWGPISLPRHKVYDILSAIYNYFCQPLTAEETRLLLETPQNIGYARRAKELRARDSMALECVILGEEGYRRIDVIGAHRGFGGILIDKLTPVVGVPAEGDVSQDSEVEVELSMALCEIPSSGDENLFY